MLDLHIESSLSRGEKSVHTLLNEVKAHNLRYFSIVDDNHAFAYNIIEEDFNNLIVGTKIECVHNGRAIKLIGYDINPKVINDWYNKVYSVENIEISEKHLAREVLKKLEVNGYPLEIEDLKYDKLNSVINQIFSVLIEMYPTFEYNNARDFRNYGIKNPESKFYVDQSEFYISVDSAISLIRKANGKVFLAHPFEYRYHVGELLEMVIDKNIDGVEVFHVSCSYLNSLKLIEFCESANKLASIGSGYKYNDELYELGVYVDEEIYDYKCFNWIFER